MNRLVRIVRNSRGWRDFTEYSARRRQQQKTAQGWWLWPYSMVLFACGVGMLGLSIYTGYVLGALFTLVWLSLVAYMSWPLRRSWQLHRAERHSR